MWLRFHWPSIIISCKNPFSVTNIAISGIFWRWDHLCWSLFLRSVSRVGGAVPLECPNEIMVTLCPCQSCFYLLLFYELAILIRTISRKRPNSMLRFFVIDLDRHPLIATLPLHYWSHSLRSSLLTINCLCHTNTSHSVAVNSKSINCRFAINSFESSIRTVDVGHLRGREMGTIRIRDSFLF